MSDLEMIRDLICEWHNVSLDQLKSSRSDDAFVKAREHYASFGRDMGISYPKIGDAINKHHTSIIHMVRRYRNV